MMSRMGDVTRSMPEPSSSWGGYGIALGLTGVLMAVLALGLWAFHRSPVLMNAINQTTTEASYYQARRLHEAGGTAGALTLYRQALAGHFSDPERRYVCMRGMAEVLVRMGRGHEAVDVLRELPESMLNEPETMVLYITALTDAYQFPEAIARATALREEAEAENNRALAEQARRLHARAVMLEPDVTAMIRTLEARH